MNTVMYRYSHVLYYFCDRELGELCMMANQFVIQDDHITSTLFCCSGCDVQKLACSSEVGMYSRQYTLILHYVACSSS